jgi:hypothetical protein
VDEWVIFKCELRIEQSATTRAIELSELEVSLAAEDLVRWFVDRIKFFDWTSPHHGVFLVILVTPTEFILALTAHNRLGLFV